MKTNYSLDSNAINDTLINTSKSTGNTLKQVSQKELPALNKTMINDSLIKEMSFIQSSDSISRDSSIIVNDTIIGSDTLQQLVVQQEPKYGGKEISRFQNIGFGNDWLVAVMLFSLFLLASVKFLFGKYLSKLVESVLNSHTANNLFLEKNINMVKGSAIINLLFVVNISLFAVSILNHNSISSAQEYGFKEFILIFAAILCLYLGKVVVIRSLGYVFKGNNESKEYIFTTFLYNKNLGLFLFPVIIALPFVQPYAVKWLMYIGVFMIFFFFTLRITRGLKILLRKHVSIFYMILYLCALEIFPLLMIYKLLVG
ncbi:DUF4271 domain-containing protein [Ancylomarina euxinus]|uniref:DUF4271 domain-containing protein n=1 Tax=Ancylomarina euxinus TaxID=2283627 RepID=A0A425Y7S3_9BACT|nr:DUF4271 domain-containing protein [Ancylomarina euxinus]MCZ4693599.1 DUF4271 domain-containing protein [Ancylomarina euxinus]MUP13827.1 DUF4271 domain-containing protein [Ancylomarina euxinus]RRG24540.1 DUF4271 domain-containing protein [Ancylomarina euxinus]